MAKEKYDPKEFAHKEFMRQLENDEDIDLVHDGDSETEDIVLAYLESDDDGDEEDSDEA